MSTPIERTRVLLANLTPDQRADLVDCLYDTYSAVREGSPYDGRTREGRAWTDALNEVLRMTRSILAVGERP
jgi:hypothetical protein